MKATTIQQRIIEKFIISEFAQGNLNTKEQVNSMLVLVKNKLNLSVEQAGEFVRQAIGINN